MTSHDGRSRKATRKTKSTKEQKMKSLKFFKPALATHHYLFVALLFASFAVASVSAATQHIQRSILFDYTTGPILCCFNEQVALPAIYRSRSRELETGFGSIAHP